MARTVFEKEELVPISGNDHYDAARAMFSYCYDQNPKYKYFTEVYVDYRDRQNGLGEGLGL